MIVIRISYDDLVTKKKGYVDQYIYYARMYVTYSIHVCVYFSLSICVCMHAHRDG